MREEKFDFDDIVIRPAIVSEIESRSEITIRDKNGFLNLFTAPMDTVVDLSNYKIFLENGIRVVLPRTISELDLPYDENSEYLWFSYSLQDIDELFLCEIKNSEKINSRAEFIQNHIVKNKLHILIDVANGHMKKLHDQVESLKKKYGDNLQLMVGNIANPLTYSLLSELGADYIRVTIGNGSGCLTSEKTSISYPSASLIQECYDISCTLNTPAKIIMDGGLKEERDFIKSFNLGADFCMSGGVFNKSLESCADTYLENENHGSWKTPGQKINQYNEQIKTQFHFGTKFYKLFRGMSTKEVQKSMGKEELKTSEGIVKLNPVKYTLSGWIDNFESYLKSAMSYTNCRTLNDFIGLNKHVFITQNAFKRFNK
jgi:hypothetical protein